MHLHKLDEFVFLVLVDPKTAIVVSDTSIKDQVAMFIAHIHIYNTSIVKTVYHAINITSTKAKLFMIRCGLNQTT